MGIFKKGMVIEFKSTNRFETILRGSTDRINGTVITDNKEYCNDFLSRWVELNFIKIYSSKEFSELNLEISN